MKTVIVYFTLTGNTESVAEKIKEELGADVVKLVPKKDFPKTGLKKFLWGGKSALMGDAPELEPYEFNADNYDMVIFGSPVWAGTFAPPLRTFIKENGDKLNGKKFAIFACHGGGSATKMINKLAALVKTEKFEAELVLEDPKNKPAEETENKIKEFVSVLC